MTVALEKVASKSTATDLKLAFQNISILTDVNNSMAILKLSITGSEYDNSI